jgi:hypothetical protein
MPRIHVVDGEKGGAGKSFFSRIVVQYCIERGIDYALVDADDPNYDVQAIYAKSSHKIKFSELPKKRDEVDLIFDLAQKKTVIVNLPAHIYNLVNDWIERNCLLDIGHLYGIDLVKWFVCTGKNESITLFKQTLEYYTDRLPHVFVKNFALTDEWDFLPSQYPELNDMFNKYQHTVKQIDLPACPHSDQMTIDRLSLTFVGALDHKKFPALSKHRVRKFLDDCYAQIDSTEHFAPHKQPVKQENAA